MVGHHLGYLSPELDCLDPVCGVGDLTLEEVSCVSGGSSLKQARCHEPVVPELGELF